jgi:hypothetical protein
MAGGQIGLLVAERCFNFYTQTDPPRWMAGGAEEALCRIVFASHIRLLGRREAQVRVGLNSRARMAKPHYLAVTSPISITAILARILSFAAPRHLPGGSNAESAIT